MTAVNLIRPGGDWRAVGDLPVSDPYGVSTDDGNETVPSFQPDAHDALIQEYATVGARYRELWAKYGAGCMLDNKRKAYLSTLAAKIRVLAAEKGTKVTESFTSKRLAHAHPDYAEWITEQELGRLAFYSSARLDLDMVREKIRTARRRDPQGGVRGRRIRGATGPGRVGSAGSC